MHISRDLIPSRKGTLSHFVIRREKFGISHPSSPHRCVAGVRPPVSVAFVMAVLLHQAMELPNNKILKILALKK